MPHRKKILGEVARGSDRYDSLFAYHPHAAYIMDVHGYYVDANAKAQELTGLNLEELKKTHFSEVVHPDDIPILQEGFDRALAGEANVIDGRVRRADGSTFDVRRTSIPVFKDGEIVGVHGITEDITEATKTLHQLEETNRQLQEALAAKSLFLANVSHEVRTPLTAICASVEFLEDGDPAPGSLRYVDIIKRNTDRLLGLMNQILDFSQLESKTVVARSNPFAVSELVASVADWAPAYAESKGLMLTVKVDEATPEVLIGDSPRLIQILTNLVQNALKFTHGGGVRVRLGLAEPECDPSVRLLRIQVEDTGIGMPAAITEKMFEPFVQANAGDTSSWNGVGLGLSICSSLAQLMGGEIQVSSVEGEGTTFTCAVPVILSGADDNG